MVDLWVGSEGGWDEQVLVGRDGWMLGSEDLMEDSQRLYMHVGLCLSLTTAWTSFRLFRAPVRRMLVLSTYLYDVTLRLAPRTVNR